jgi:hypothetical protein
MGTLTKAQRSSILERLEHNPKYAIAISFAATFPQKNALEFASLFKEAGWKVTGPFPSEKGGTKSFQIGVPDLHCPCPGARLLVDVFVSVGLLATLVWAPEAAHPTQSSGCCLLLNWVETNQGHKGHSNSSETPSMYDI